MQAAKAQAASKVVEGEPDTNRALLNLGKLVVATSDDDCVDDKEAGEAPAGGPFR